MDIKEFCRQLDRLLGNRDLYGQGLDTAIKAICKGLGVGAGEIAVFLADEDAGALRFLWPRGLKNSGTVPFSSKESLAARTYRDVAGSVNNRFSAVRHVSIFEALPFQKHGGKSLPIQKIISVPIRTKETCLSVLQVCRKAVDMTAAGPDFISVQLLGAGLIARTLARHL